MNHKKWSLSDLLKPNAEVYNTDVKFDTHDIIRKANSIIVLLLMCLNKQQKKTLLSEFAEGYQHNTEGGMVN